MVELKVNGTDCKETMKTTEQINTMNTKEFEGTTPTNCPISVLLTRREDEVLNGEKNGETTGLLRYAGKDINFFPKIVNQVVDPT